MSTEKKNEGTKAYNLPLVVEQQISTTPETVHDHKGNPSALSIASDSVDVDGPLTVEDDLVVRGTAVRFSGLPNLPNSGMADLVIHSGGAVSVHTSSARFKENIEPLQEDFCKLLLADPVSFTNKATGDCEIGYVAENLHENELENLVSYDAEGKPLSVRYKLLPIYVLEIMKEQQRVIKDLQGDIADIKERMRGT